MPNFSNTLARLHHSYTTGNAPVLYFKSENKFALSNFYKLTIGKSRTCKGTDSGIVRTLGFHKENSYQNVTGKQVF